MDSFRPIVIVVLVAAALPVLAVPLTNNNVNDLWSVTHPTMVGERLIWTEDDQDVIYFDGTTAVPVQQLVSGVPELDFVANFVFGLGSGASAGEVVGAWRRGADYAWVWTSGQAPVQIDTHGTNPFVPGGATNPENVAIADGCVFMITQAQDPNDGSGNVYKNVFQVSTLDGSVTPVSGNLRAFGADRVVTSGCRAAWVYEPNDSILVNDQPYELQYWDGATTVTLDRGAIDRFDIDLADDKLVYVKEIEQREQIFLLELDDPSPTIRQVTDSMADKHSPRTDGRHVAWGEQVKSPAGVSLGDVRLLGEMRVAPRVSSRPAAGSYAILLDGGQLAWRIDAPGQNGPLYYLADNAVELLDPQVHGNFTAPHLSRGWLAWRGVVTGAGNDQEISLHQGTAAQDLSLAPPPLFVRAELGPERLTLSWDEVLDVDSYTVYLAEEPGVTPGNYPSLQGGMRIEGAVAPLSVAGIDPAATYYAVVTTTESGSEGQPSGEAATFGYLVDSVIDTVDTDPGDGSCLDALGSCSLRAAVMEASAANEGFPTVAIPAGLYALTRVGIDDSGLLGDLDLLAPMALLGAGAEQTIVNGFQNRGVLHADPARDGFLTRIADVTLTGADQGMINSGESRLDRLRIRDNGGDGNSQIGAAIYQNGEMLELYDSELDGNVTDSHGGAILVNGTTTDIWRTSIHDNEAGLGGGAIYHFPRDTRLTDSTLRDNSSRRSANWSGGAIFQEGGWLTLRRSAVVDNDSPDCGGALYTGGGTVVLLNTTVSGNHADVRGGGICSQGGDNLTLVHSTLAFNTAANGPTMDLGSGQTLRLFSSILHNTDGVTDCAFSGALAAQDFGINIGDLSSCVGDSEQSLNVDPLLDVLADNGGITPTHALLSGSPALDAVPDGECVDRQSDEIATDQRGEPRPIDHDGDAVALCDSGAYEAAVACIDDDDDGFPASASAGCLAGVPADCDDADGSSWSLPGENLQLLFSDTQSFGWSAPLEPGGTTGTLVHEILRSEEPFDLSTTATCVLGAPGSTAAVDAATPASGGLFVFLTRATNGCAGESSWGLDSFGGERVAICP